MKFQVRLTNADGTRHYSKHIDIQRDDLDPDTQKTLAGKQAEVACNHLYGNGCKVLGIVCLEDRHKYDSMRMFSIDIVGEKHVRKFVEHMITESGMFIVEPLPDDVWRVFVNDQVKLDAYVNKGTCILEGG